MELLFSQLMLLMSSNWLQSIILKTDFHSNSPEN